MASPKYIYSYLTLRRKNVQNELVFPSLCKYHASLCVLAKILCIAKTYALPSSGARRAGLRQGTI